MGINIHVVDNIALNTESTIPIYDISRQNGNSEYLLSNDASSGTEIKNILEYIDHGNVGVEFISLDNDSSAHKK